MHPDEVWYTTSNKSDVDFIGSEMSFELDKVVNFDPKIVELLNKLRDSKKIAVMVIIAFQLARLLAVKLVEQELSRRAEEPTEWSNCSECGARLGAIGRLVN